MVLITDEDVKAAMRAMREVLKTGSPKEKLDVATYFIDRKYGKPRQAVEHSGPEGGDMRHNVTFTIFDAPAT
jgi:hypothetical protein